LSPRNSPLHPSNQVPFFQAAVVAEAVEADREVEGGQPEVDLRAAASV
jgi:hypothetical protein